MQNKYLDQYTNVCPEPVAHEVAAERQRDEPRTISLYPITLTNLVNQLVVVVGGGPVATRKVSKLLDTGALVRVVSPDVTESLQQLSIKNRIEWLEREFAAGDLMGARLAFAATNLRPVNAQVAQEAQLLGILCNVADAPAEGTFNVPASHHGDGLVVAVSTEEGSPKRAIQARNAIAEWMQQR